MESFLTALKTLKPWQIAVLVVVLLGAAGSTYGGYTRVNGTGQGDLGEDQQLIPVQFGDLVNQVSTSGNIIFPNRETLTFDSQGTVVEVLVEEGEQVVKGQVLAKLERTRTQRSLLFLTEASLRLEVGELVYKPKRRN